MKLVIVEGIPGSGKSTTARFIALQYERNGFETELYHESTSPHPMILDADSSHVTEWMERYVANWKAFVRDRRDKDVVVVMEAALFQNPILRLLHKDVSRQEIVRFLSRLDGIVGDTDNRFVYLYQSDPSLGIRRMIETRGGDAWLQNAYDRFKHEPYYSNRKNTWKELHIEFLQEYASLANQAFTSSSLDALPVENTNGDWDAYNKEILNFLGLSFSPDPDLEPEHLVKYAGTYRNEELGVSVLVEIGHEGLYIFGDYRLKPRATNKFYLDTVSMTLEFIDERDGLCNAVIVSEKDIVGNRKDEGTEFVRIS